MINRFEFILYKGVDCHSELAYYHSEPVEEFMKFLKNLCYYRLSMT